MKQEGKDRYGKQFTKWQKKAWEFEIDDQPPVRYEAGSIHPIIMLGTLGTLSSNLKVSNFDRQLWYRASLAWQDILGREDVFSGLLAAHNAVNQVFISCNLPFISFVSQQCSNWQEFCESR